MAEELDAQEQRLQLGQRKALHLRGYFGLVPQMRRAVDLICSRGADGRRRVFPATKSLRCNLFFMANRAFVAANRIMLQPRTLTKMCRRSLLWDSPWRARFTALSRTDVAGPLVSLL